jgi:hypothetical protein
MTGGSKNNKSEDPGNMITSLWTLNYTNTWAVIKTIFVYAAFILFMWYFYEQGFVIFKNWQAKEINQMLNTGLAEGILWLGRIAFIIMLILVIRKPVANRNTPG